jgi:hypothetical protein
LKADSLHLNFGLFQIPDALYSGKLPKNYLKLYRLLNTSLHFQPQATRLAYKTKGCRKKQFDMSIHSMKITNSPEHLRDEVTTIPGYGKIKLII